MPFANPQKVFALFDYDGTLVNNHHLMSFDKHGDEFDWVKFMTDSYSAPSNDKVVAAMHELQAEDVICIICTARPDRFDVYTMKDQIDRNLGEDFSTMRSDELYQDELDELRILSESNVSAGQYKEAIHRHHAVYRNHVVDDLEERYGKGCVKYAFDDQVANLNVLALRGAKCFLVSKDGDYDQVSGL